MTAEARGEFDNVTPAADAKFEFLQARSDVTCKASCINATERSVITA